MSQLVIDILVRRIKNGENNPATGEPMKLEDIKIPEYKAEVERILIEDGFITPEVQPEELPEA